MNNAMEEEYEQPTPDFDTTWCDNCHNYVSVCSDICDNCETCGTAPREE